MAKDGDIIETMLGWIVDLFCWIIGGIIKLITVIIGSLFTAIFSSFKKDKVENTGEN